MHESLTVILPKLSYQGIHFNLYKLDSCCRVHLTFWPLMKQLMPGVKDLPVYPFCRILLCIFCWMCCTVSCAGVGRERREKKREEEKKCSYHELFFPLDREYLPCPHIAGFYESHPLKHLGVNNRATALFHHRKNRQLRWMLSPSWRSLLIVTAWRHVKLG